MTKRLRFSAPTLSLLTAAFASLLLVGCGSDSSSSDATTPSAGGSSASAGQGGAAGSGAGVGGSGGSAVGGSSGGTAGTGGSAVADDPVWGPAAKTCPSEAPIAGSPALLGRDCDPIDPTFCGFPFPSNVYLADDPTGKSATGKSVRFGAKTLPIVEGQLQTDPALFYDRDGFSTGSGPLFHLPGATSTGMNNPESIGDSLLATSPTVLMEADTGVIVPHWGEIDMSTSRTSERAILIHPAVRLKDRTRYIVAIRNVVDKNGATIPPSPFFKALRDGTSDCAPQLLSLRKAQYDDIFAKLTAAGIDRASLQVAWDYTTSSQESNVGDVLAVRDAALAKVGNGPFSYKVVSVLDNPDSATWKRVVLSVTLPLYLNHADAYDNTKPDIIPALNRDANGVPAQNGEFEWQVRISIPKSAENAAPGSHGLLQNEHGLLGRSSEGQGDPNPPNPMADPGYLAHMANLHNWIAFGIDFMGFCHEDTTLLTDGLATDPAKFRAFVDRQVQGHVNQLLMMRFMMTTFAQGITDDGTPNGKVIFDGKAVDPKVRAYRGDSQGGIMGISYMAISTDVTRGLLGEPGLPYNTILNRSVDYSGYGGILYTSLHNGLAIQLVLGSFEMMWDRTEPNGFAPYIVENTLPCSDANSCPGGKTPVHQVLIHDGIGDCQVSTYAAQILARTVHAKSLNPAPRMIWGVDNADDITNGSGIVEYDFHLDPVPLTNVAPSLDYCMDHDPHDWVRQLKPSYDQSDWFFRNGEIKPFCKGVCSCFDPDPAQSEDYCDKL